MPSLFNSMKKGFIFCLVFLFLLFININLSSAEVTGDIVSGEVVSQPVTMNITVTSINVPSLSLLNPENETYITTKNILLNFVSIDADFIWYNLDSGSNITITGNTTFNTTGGAHTLSLYANNSNGETSKNIVFTVDSSIFRIIYSSLLYKFHFLGLRERAKAH